MAVKFTRPMAAPAIDIPFAHATDEVLAECGDVYFPPGTNPNDYIFFK